MIKKIKWLIVLCAVNSLLVAHLQVAVVSNRGPLEHHFTTTGDIVGRESDGGLATVLCLFAKQMPITWIANANTPADRVMSKVGPIKLNTLSSLRLVKLPAGHELPYQRFCNTILWFLHHSMFNKLSAENLEKEIRTGWQEGYLPVNKIFADTLVAYVGCMDAIMIHDFHFYPLPKLLREKCLKTFLQYFVHIPWPTAQEWEVLPSEIVQEICQSLLSCNSLVFQTKDFMTNFFDTCVKFLPEVAINLDKNTITYKNCHTHIWTNPATVDIGHLEKQVEKQSFSSFIKDLRVKKDQKIILRIDRIDPAKNIDIGFEAFACLLEKYPEWREKVCFFAQIYPSRTAIKEYADYNLRVTNLIHEINQKFGTLDWTPITVFSKPDRLRALYAMTVYDVLLVNSLADGLNLVSKEGSILNNRNGVLVLSKKTGSYAELYKGALGISPESIEETAQALYTALNMPLVERQERAQALKNAISVHQNNDWVTKLLLDISQNNLKLQK